MGSKSFPSQVDVDVMALGIEPLYQYSTAPGSHDTMSEHHVKQGGSASVIAIRHGQLEEICSSTAEGKPSVMGR